MRQKKVNQIANAIIGLLTCGVIVLAGMLINGAVNKQEMASCYEWQKQANEYPNFTLTKWQQEQCEHHNISVT